MLPVLRIGVLTLAVSLASATAAQAAPTLSVPVPAEGQVAVAVAGSAQGMSVASAPAGVTVAGGVKRGRLAVAVVRPHGVAASGKVVFRLRGKPKGAKTFAAALNGGKAGGAACPSLGALLGKRLKGSVDTKALAPVLAATLCGRSAPAGAAATLARLKLGLAPLGTLGTTGGTLTRPGGVAKPAPPTATPTPAPPAGKRACDNDIDDDGDGQTDWEDPGCSDAGDSTENSEVPVSAECAASSGVGMGDDPTALGAGINAGCGTFYAIEVDVAPGIESCDVFTAEHNFDCTVFAPIAHASSKDDRTTDMADVMLNLTGPVDCGKPATIALFRANGEVAELREPVGSCKTLPAPPPACSNGKDDDGDGMIDSRDAAATTDPDPGCGAPADRTEGSEIPTPESCEVEIGLFGGDKRLPGLIAEGCGVLKGVWFKPPGTPTDCVFRFGEDPVQDCIVKAGTGGATFALTNQTVLLAAPIAADAACVPVTVALIREDDSVMADRVSWC